MTRQPEPEFAGILFCMSPTTARDLIGAGFTSLADIRNADDRELLSIWGIGPVTVAAIRREIDAHDEDAVREVERMRKIVALYDKDPWRVIDGYDRGGWFARMDLA